MTGVPNKTLLFIGFLAVLSCNKKDASLKYVLIQGRAWDDNKQVPIADLLVYLFNVKCENWACHFDKILDSTRTDNNGYYQIRYKPKESYEFHVSCGFAKNEYIVAPPAEQERIVDLGNNVVNFILRKTSVLKARVLVKDNAFLPLTVADHIQWFPPEIGGANNDTTVYLYGIPNQSNMIDLITFEPPTQEYFRKRSDTITLNGFADTFNITIVAEPKTFPRFKYY